MANETLQNAAMSIQFQMLDAEYRSEVGFFFRNMVDLRQALDLPFLDQLQEQHDLLSDLRNNLIRLGIEAKARKDQSWEEIAEQVLKVERMREALGFITCTRTTI